MGMNGSKYMKKQPLLRDYPGEHAVKVAGIKEDTSPQKRMQRTRITCDVLASTNPALQKRIDTAGKPVKIEHMIFLGEFIDYYYSERREFLGAAVGHEPGDDDYNWESAFQDGVSGKLNGRTISVDVTDTGKLSKKGNPIIEVEFSPAPVS